MARKRGQNEGSIFQRKDGRWCGVLNLGWENGRRKRKNFYGKTASEVQEHLLKARSDHSRGLPVAIERQTVGQYLDHWLEHTLKAKAKPRSYESFSTIARLHIKPSLGKIQLHKLAPQHIQKLLDEKSKKGLSPQTVTNIRTVLRSALSQAMKWNLVSRNSAAFVNAPRIPHKRIEPLNPTHARKLLETAKGGRYEAIYTVATSTASAAVARRKVTSSQMDAGGTETVRPSRSPSSTTCPTQPSRRRSGSSSGSWKVRLAR